jgi:D-amino-acid dehydrogenase
MSKVIVLGGGIIGLCSAYYLNKAGHDVTLIDRGDISQGTSFGNAGYICPSHFIPLASPGIIAMGLKWMLSSTSPFYIKPRLNMDLIRWGLAFWKSSGKSTMEKNIMPLHEILQLSRTMTIEMRNDLGNHFQMEERGCLMLYKSAQTEKHEIEMAHDAQGLNIPTRILNAREVQDLEPKVEVNVRGGVLYPFDAHLHPGDLMHTLYEHLKKNGVSFELNTTITGFEKKSNEVTGVQTSKGLINGEQYVLATGSWLPFSNRDLGIDLLLQAGKGYSMTFGNMTHNLLHPAILVDDRVAMTPFGSELRMGGTMEISGIGSPMLIKRAKAIFNSARQYYPALDVKFPSADQIWHGWRPLSPDGLPYIGKHSKYNNLTFAGGHGMLGISLAAGTGKLVQELVSGENTTIKIQAFAVERFN